MDLSHTWIKRKQTNKQHCYERDDVILQITQRLKQKQFLDYHPEFLRLSSWQHLVVTLALHGSEAAGYNYS